MYIYLASYPPNHLCLHRFRHLLMQIAWFVSFSNFPSAAVGHILLNALDLF